jgi:aldose 1-epimerase
MTLELRSGNYHAEIRLRGAGLNFLRYQDRDLVDPYVEEDEPHRYRGVVLAPWPNRIRDGQYTFNQKEFTLHKNENNRHNALHGLVFDVYWNIQTKVTNSISLTTLVHANDGYPTDLEIIARYTLSNEGLECKVDCKNLGSQSAPYGVSIHPYLIADKSSKVDQCVLTMPSHEYMEVDLDRLLPVGVSNVPNNFDFNAGKLIGADFIDHAFHIDQSKKDQYVTLVAPSGKGVKMTYSEAAKWIQIHTADREGGADSRTCLAVEPMSCPPDAFNSGVDVSVLSVGETHTISWQISAI